MSLPSISYESPKKACYCLNILISQNYFYISLYIGALSVSGVVKPQKMMASDHSESILDIMKVHTIIIWGKKN